MSSRQQAAGGRQQAAGPQSAIHNPQSTIRGAAPLLLGLLLIPAVAGAQDFKRPEFVRIRVGFADRYKVGHWTPVEVTIRGGSESITGVVTLTVPDGDGVPSRVGGIATPENMCRVTPGQDTSVLMYVRFGQIESDLIARFHLPAKGGGKGVTFADKVVAEQTFQTGYEVSEVSFLPAIPTNQQLIVTVGSTSAGVSEAVQLQEKSFEEQPVVAQLNDVDQLSTRWYGYEGVDAVVLSTSHPEVYRKLSVNSARVQALDDWIRMGGRLVFCVGSQADQVLHREAPLARFAPGRLDGVITLRQTRALEAYSNSSTPITSAGGGRVELRVPQLADVQGKIEAKEASLPLVVRCPRSFGQIIFLATDLDRPPLARWKDRKLLVAMLLDAPSSPTEETDPNAAIMDYGNTDMAGQLRRALDRFTGVRLVPFWLVALLIIGYIILIGPVDYFFLRKLVRRMELTWITFPCIVLGVSLGAYFLAYWLKGDQLRINQVDLVDVDSQSGRVRGTTWLNIFSPRMDAYNLSFQPRLPDGRIAQDPSVLTSWLGLPGGALGGMNPRTSNSMLWRRQYDFSPRLDAMSGVPIQVWSTKSITGRFSARTQDTLTADLLERDGLPEGTITNTLDFPLSNCLLAYDRWAFELGTIAPGESVRVNSRVDRRELKTLLTGQKIVYDAQEEKYQQSATPYDPSSADVSAILRRMMFFEAAGGRQFTRLANSYQRFVDFSLLLKANRAILVATAPDSDAGQKHQGAVLLRDGRPMSGPQDKHVTFYRFVFPVNKPSP